jgi:heme oxygenase
VDVEDLETVQFDENADPVERHRLPSSESTQSGTETTQNPQDAEARNPGLARLLKKGTSRSHRAAENVHFVRDFMQHKVSADSYKELLGALFHVYSALEEELDRCSKIDSRVKAIHFPFLERKETLLQDLQYFHGSNYAAFAEALEYPSPAAKQYADRLREIGKSQPVLLVAHSYTRYLGDLSGGQLLAKAAVKSFNLSEANGIEDGTSFFHFKAVPNANTFKHEYRAALDGLHVSKDEIDDLVDEANLAFIHNMRLFQERDVAAGYITAVQSIEDAMLMVSQAKSALSFQTKYAELGGEPDASAQCPFLPKRQSSGPQPRLERRNSECPIMSFASFFLPGRIGVKEVLLGSLVIGTALQRAFARRKLA